MVNNAEVTICLKSKRYKFYYSYNSNSSFLDLLEYFSYLFPELEVCQCFEFEVIIRNSYDIPFANFGKTIKYNTIKIENDFLIKKYSEYLSSLELIDKREKNSCIHCSKNYLKYPKSKIISFFQEEIDKLKSNNKNLNKEKDEKEKEIKILNKEKIEQEKEIKYLNKEKNEKELKINDLNKEKNEQELKINDLNKERNEQELKINDLNKEINEQELKINDLNKEKIGQEMKISSLNRDKNLLEFAINGDIEKINLLNNLGVEGYNLNKINNFIQIDNNTNQIRGNQNYIKEKFIDFYDVIIHIDSIKDINKGWKIEFNEKTKENYESLKNQKIIKIGVIGNSNKGKSFLLSKISKINLPSGTSIRTEGLSIKYPDLEKFKDRKIVLLDSAGLETPVLNLKKSDNFPDDKINELFREKSREKLITELFLQNYIINNSDVLITVVGILTYSEQKLLMKIKKEIERSKINTPLFIIHNLITFTSVQQVQEYINDFLLKSATFTLEEGHKISTKTQSKTGMYFYESNKEQKIFHLIFANENSEAGKYYNQFTLDFLENNYQGVTHLKTFDVIETIKERFLKLSKDIIEKTDEKDLKLAEEKSAKANDNNNAKNSHEDKVEEEITKDNFDDSNPDLIKLKDEKEIILKKCLTDELGFSNLKANGFEPTYNLFKQGNKIIVRVEAAGNCKIDSEMEFAGEYNIIKLRGEKRKDKDPKNEKDNLFNTREYGSFSLEIPLKTEDFLLSNEEPSIESNLEYKLAQKAKKKEFEINEDDEI